MNISPKSPIPNSISERIIEDIQYHEGLRAYDLHKHLGIIRVSVHKHLRMMLNKGVLKKIGNPPLVQYVLSHDSNVRERKLETIKDRVLPTLKEANVKKAAIFGSYARGDNTNDSDVDILVDLPDKATLFDLAGIKQDLEEILKREVDVIEYEGINSLIKESILKHQYPIL